MSHSRALQSLLPSRRITALRWPPEVGTASAAVCVTFAAVLALLSSALSGRAQGTLTVLQTGGGQTLVNSQQVLQIAGIATPEIVFDFGFATDETPAPGIFLDSFTLTLEASSSDVAVVATIDASGTDWLPVSPGTAGLPSDDLQWQTITPPSQSPIFGQGVAYSVEVSLPPSFAGSTLTANFALFDNGNSAVTAAGWYQNVSVVSVPEPQVAACMILGLAMCLIERKTST